MSYSFIIIACDKGEKNKQYYYGNNSSKNVQGIRVLGKKLGETDLSDTREGKKKKSDGIERLETCRYMYDRNIEEFMWKLKNVEMAMSHWEGASLCLETFESLTMVSAMLHQCFSFCFTTLSAPWVSRPKPMRCSPSFAPRSRRNICRPRQTFWANFGDEQMIELVNVLHCSYLFTVYCLFIFDQLTFFWDKLRFWKKQNNQCFLFGFSFWPVFWNIQNSCNNLKQWHLTTKTLKKWWGTMILLNWRLSESKLGTEPSDSLVPSVFQNLFMLWSTSQFVSWKALQFSGTQLECRLP